MAYTTKKFGLRSHVAMLSHICTCSCMFMPSHVVKPSQHQHLQAHQNPFHKTTYHMIHLNMGQWGRLWVENYLFKDHGNHTNISYFMTTTTNKLTYHVNNKVVAWNNRLDTRACKQHWTNKVTTSLWLVQCDGA